MRKGTYDKDFRNYEADGTRTVPLTTVNHELSETHSQAPPEVKSEDQGLFKA